MRPILILQHSSRERIGLLREGLGGLETVIPLGIGNVEFWSLAGLDALYVSLPLAEQWGSRPIPPHTAMVLRTREDDAKRGLPPHIISGLVLNSGEPDTGRFGIPLIIEATLRAAGDFNHLHGRAIRVIGFFEHELSYPDLDGREAGELIRSSYEETLKKEKLIF